MVYSSESQLLHAKAYDVSGNEVTVKEQSLLQTAAIDNIAETMLFSDNSKLIKLSYWLAYNLGIRAGVIPASIQGLYQAMGERKVSGFTVPAMNIRTLTYDLARAVFHAARKINAGAFIFEIAKSEIGYTDQRPLEYSSMIILAALREGFQGPVFIQGDHFQVKAKSYLKDPAAELTPLKTLIQESIEAHFYNIDIDTSTLVDLSKPNLDEQQKLNYQVCAEITRFIRQLQPQGMPISIGGEIGEVGGKNSTPEELHAFMGGYRKEIASLKGISKISIQTGTSHGGVVLPDGSIAKVNIDLDTLAKLSDIARKNYRLAGAVQHGASTLPNEAFHHFPKVGCAEIHLATQFQNIVYDFIPLALKEKIYSWLHENCTDEKKPNQTNDQFIYTARKKALGPFKRELHSLTKDVRKKISQAMEEEFSFLFEQLNIKDTKVVVDKYVKPVAADKKIDYFLKEKRDLGVLEGAD